MAEQPLWAQGLVLAVSGFEKSERRQIEQIVSSAGGEYSAGLSRRCTVLLIPRGSPDPQTGPGSRKLELFFKNRHKHKAKLLVKKWLSDCLKRGVLLDMAAYEVLPQGTTDRDQLPSPSLHQAYCSTLEQSRPTKSSITAVSRRGSSPIMHWLAQSSAALPAQSSRAASLFEDDCALILRPRRGKLPTEATCSHVVHQKSSLRLSSGQNHAAEVLHDDPRWRTDPAFDARGHAVHHTQHAPFNSTLLQKGLDKGRAAACQPILQAASAQSRLQGQGLQQRTVSQQHATPAEPQVHAPPCGANRIPSAGTGATKSAPASSILALATHGGLGKAGAGNLLPAAAGTAVDQGESVGRVQATPGLAYFHSRPWRVQTPSSAASSAGMSATSSTEAKPLGHHAAMGWFAASLPCAANPAANRTSARSAGMSASSNSRARESSKHHTAINRAATISPTHRTASDSAAVTYQAGRSRAEHSAEYHAASSRLHPCTLDPARNVAAGEVKDNWPGSIIQQESGAFMPRMVSHPVPQALAAAATAGHQGYPGNVQQLSGVSKEHDGSNAAALQQIRKQPFPRGPRSAVSAAVAKSMPLGIEGHHADHLLRQQSCNQVPWKHFKASLAGAQSTRAGAVEQENIPPDRAFGSSNPILSSTPGANEAKTDAAPLDSLVQQLARIQQQRNIRITGPCTGQANRRRVLLHDTAAVRQPQNETYTPPADCSADRTANVSLSTILHSHTDDSASAPPSGTVQRSALDASMQKGSSPASEATPSEAVAPFQHDQHSKCPIYTCADVSFDIRQQSNVADPAHPKREESWEQRPRSSRSSCSMADTLNVASCQAEAEVASVPSSEGGPQKAGASMPDASGCSSPSQSPQPSSPAEGPTNPTTDVRGLSHGEAPPEGDAAAGDPAQDGSSLMSAKGVFEGMQAVLDPSVAPAEASRVHTAWVEGGGSLKRSAHLGKGISHVICTPEAASAWLGMGVSIVSPQWVLRSLKGGEPQRCLQISLDTLAHLPAPSSQHAGIHPLTSEQIIHSTPSAAPQTLEQKRSQSMSSGWAQMTPPMLLEGILWSVTADPGSALWDRCPGSMQDGALGDIIPDSPGADVDEATSAGLAQESLGAAMLAADMESIVYKAPSITILFPLDASGQQGHSAQCTAIEGAVLSRGQLLRIIHQFYQAASLSSLSSTSGVSAPGSTAAGLGARCSLEGLSKVSREASGTIYELCLGC
ncbi:hypothetical protein WJX74_009524 [Apatococcus lobatus]|uniref:BRCT domain-containing protein n=1 Tax=Apatococcus lobatus TaxID=904363 RepID=A0AAW1S3T9_9CHLO